MRLGGMLDIKVTVDTASVITALYANRQKHVAEYKEAMDNYWVEIEKMLDTFAGFAAKKELRKDNFIQHHPVPVNAEKMYDKYINMFRAHQDPTIELSASDYAMIVEDEWDWAVSAKLTNSTYSNSR